MNTIAPTTAKSAGEHASQIDAAIPPGALPLGGNQEQRAIAGFEFAAGRAQGPGGVSPQGPALSDVAANARDAINRPDLPSQLAGQAKDTLINLGMYGYERALLGSTIKDGSQLLRDLPEARAWLQDQLKADLPPQAQATLNAFIDKLASGDPAQLMRDMPKSVGQVHVLDAYQTNGQNQLVPRAQTPSLQGLTHVADPALLVLAAAGKGAVAGRAVGQATDQATAIYGQAQLMNHSADMALVPSCINTHT